MTCIEEEDINSEAFESFTQPETTENNYDSVRSFVSDKLPQTIETN